MFSWCSAHTGHTGAAQGCMSVGASYSQGWLPGIPEEWGGGCHTHPNPFSRHFLCKTHWPWKQLGECGKFSKGNKEKRRSEASCSPLGPPHCSEVGETRVRRSQTTCSGSSRSPSSQFSSLSRRSRPPSQEHRSTAGYLRVEEGTACVSPGSTVWTGDENTSDYRVTWKAISATLDRGETRRGRVLKQVRRWETGWNPGGRHAGGGNACTWPWGGGE